MTANKLQIQVGVEGTTQAVQALQGVGAAASSAAGVAASATRATISAMEQWLAVIAANTGKMAEMRQASGQLASAQAQLGQATATVTSQAQSTGATLAALAGDAASAAAAVSRSASQISQSSRASLDAYLGMRQRIQSSPDQQQASVFEDVFTRRRAAGGDALNQRIDSQQEYLAVVASLKSEADQARVTAAELETLGWQQKLGADATDRQKAAVAALVGQMQTFRQVEGERQAALSAGARLTAELETQQERLARREREYQELLSRGAITAETHARAMTRLAEDRERLTRQGISGTGADAEAAMRQLMRTRIVAGQSLANVAAGQLASHGNLLMAASSAPDLLYNLRMMREAQAAAGASTGAGGMLATAGVVAAVAAVGGAFATLVGHARAADQAVRSMGVTLAAVGHRSGLTGQGMMGMANELSLKMSPFSRDEIRGSIQSLADGMTAPDVLERLQDIGIEYAAATGQGVKEGSKQIADAFKGGWDGIATLDNSLHILTRSEREQIRAMLEHGQQAEAMRTTLAALERQFSGLAEQGMSPVDRASHSLGNAWDQLMDAMSKTSIVRDMSSAIDVFARSVESANKQSLALNLGQRRLEIEAQLNQWKNGVPQFTSREDLERELKEIAAEEVRIATRDKGIPKAKPWQRPWSSVWGDSPWQTWLQPDQSSNPLQDKITDVQKRLRIANQQAVDSLRAQSAGYDQMAAAVGHGANAMIHAQRVQMELQEALQRGPEAAHALADAWEALAIRQRDFQDALSLQALQHQTRATLEMAAVLGKGGADQREAWVASQNQQRLDQGLSSQIELLRQAAEANHALEIAQRALAASPSVQWQREADDLEQVIAKMREMGAAERDVVELRRQMVESRLSRSSSWADGVRLGIMRLEDQTKTTAETIATMMVSATDRMADAFAEFVTTGKLSFGDLARSVAADMAKMAAKKAMTEGLKMIFPDLFGGDSQMAKEIKTATITAATINANTINTVTGGKSGQGGATTSLFDWGLGSSGSSYGPESDLWGMEDPSSGGGSSLSGVAGLFSFLTGFFHTGGMAGSPTTQRMIPAALFAGAPRLHTGGYPTALAYNERPAILLDNERVLNPQETRVFNAALAMTGGAEARRDVRGGGGMTVNNSINVQAPQGRLTRKSMSQVQAALAESMLMQMRRLR